MSLVAYSSGSEESDEEEETSSELQSSTSKEVTNKLQLSASNDVSVTTAIAVQKKNQPRSSRMFENLPKPKKQNDAMCSTEISALETSDQLQNNKLHATSEEVAINTSDSVDKSESSLFENLPKPKNQKEIINRPAKVKISIPSLLEFEEDPEDLNEPAKKKFKPSQKKCGLFDLLPRPKNQFSAAPRQIASASRAALHPATVVKSEKIIRNNIDSKTSVAFSSKNKTTNWDSDEEDTTSVTDFFSLSDTPKQPSEKDDEFSLKATVSPYKTNHHTQQQPTVATYKTGYSTQQLPTVSPYKTGYGTEQQPTVSYKTNYNTQQQPTVSSYEANYNTQHLPTVYPYETNYGTQQQPTVSSYEANYNTQHLPTVSPYETNYGTQQQPTVSSYQATNNLGLSKDVLEQLCGRRGARLEDIELVDVREDAILSESKELLAKHLTQETSYKPRPKKGDGPSVKEKRKHQITFLAHQAKENELDLKNKWASNRFTKKQTQSKYGF